MDVISRQFDTLFTFTPSHPISNAHDRAVSGPHPPRGHGYVRAGWGEKRKSKRDTRTSVACAMQVAFFAGLNARRSAPSGTG
eukprot:7382766-Prymnesium_polylepis.3